MSRIPVLVFGQIIFFFALSSAFAADPDAPVRTPGEFQKPKDSWQVPGEIQKPRDKWQEPGQFQKPNGDWVAVKEIPIPKEIAKVEIKDDAKCERTLSLGADTLFAFDRFDLTPEGEKAVAALGPIIVGHKPKTVAIQGHTDSKGSDDYNQTLSEKRAQTVTARLKQDGFLPAAVTTFGRGEKKPVAPNEKPDGSDDPDGRQKNRRVEVTLFGACAEEHATK